LQALLNSMRARAAFLDMEETHLTESAILADRLRAELDVIDATDNQARKREVIEKYVRQITAETRLGPRKLDATVTLYLRFRPEPIVVANDTYSPGNRPWRPSASSWPFGASTAASA
jgi:hypothetical protein